MIYFALILGTIFGALFVITLFFEGQVAEAGIAAFVIFILMAVADHRFALFFPFAVIGMFLWIVLRRR